MMASWCQSSQHHFSLRYYYKHSFITNISTVIIIIITTTTTIIFATATATATATTNLPTAFVNNISDTDQCKQIGLWSFPLCAEWNSNTGHSHHLTQITAASSYMLYYSTHTILLSKNQSNITLIKGTRSPVRHNGTLAVRIQKRRGWTTDSSNAGEMWTSRRQCTQTQSSPSESSAAQTTETRITNNNNNVRLFTVAVRTLQQNQHLSRRTALIQ